MWSHYNNSNSKIIPIRYFRRIQLTANKSLGVDSKGEVLQSRTRVASRAHQEH